MSVRWNAARVMGFGAGGLLVLGALVSLAGCGGGSSDDTGEPTTAPQTKAATAATDVTPGSTARPPSSSGEIDVCALVTKAEVEAAVGTAVLEPKAEQVANLASCSFSDPGAPVFGLVSVSVLTGSRAGDAQEIFDMAKRNANEPQAVSGLGQDAFWDDVLGTLNVVQDQYEVSVDVASIDNGDRMAAAKTVAAKVLGRLP